MRVLIIEDELPAAKRLQKLLLKAEPEAEILEVIDSVEDSVAWFGQHKDPDLVFMDIQLADGQSFEIFRHCEFQSPIIFTTAYDEYALKAFKVNSLDYLLKPIDPEELCKGIAKYRRMTKLSYSPSLLRDLAQQLQPSFKERFVIKIGDQLRYVPVTDIAYFHATDGSIFLYTKTGKRFLIDQKMEDLDTLLNPKVFMRINRSFIVHLSSVNRIHTYFNGRYKLELNPDISEEVIVSRDRSRGFRNWLDA